MYKFKKKTLHLSVCSVLFLSATHVYAQSNADKTAQTLPTLAVTADTDSTPNYAAKTATSGLKSDTPLFKTAQSVTVVTAEQLNQKQASTLSDAIGDVAGVSAANRSRRGWDDINIRGQSASNQIFIDGLRQTNASDVATDLSGIDQIQVIKGPASVNFGQSLPGGIVNLVTKRPQAESFAKADLTYGSYNFKEGQFDLNYSPNQTKEGAFRLTGRVADQKDEVDYVYFKNFYISPSYNFDLGDKAKLSVIASYQRREYMRLQGIPILGTLKNNPNGPIERSAYLGEPSFGPYKGDVYRFGYIYNYDFGNELSFEQNFAVRKAEMDGRFISMNQWVANSRFTTITRNAVSQDFDNLNYTIDNQLKKNLSFSHSQHQILAGVDGMHEKREQNNFNCKVANFNFYKPTHYTGIDCSTPSSRLRTDVTTQYIGLYLRDQINIQDKLIVNLSGRYDWVKAETDNLITTKKTSQNHRAFTGSGSALYNINNWVAPYISYSTSFFPNSGTDKNGSPFDPQKGKQLETGFKFQNDSQSLQGSLAWYTLALDNVLVSDPSATGFNITDGQQKTKGIEAELVANLSDQLRINASFSHMYEAKISKDTSAARVGQRLENTPENTYSLSTRYYTQSDSLGWYVGAGVRGESSKPITGDTSVNVPRFSLFDTEAGYNALNWGAQLSIRNLFDKEYYAGTIANRNNDNRLVALGNPRQINFSVKFKY